MDCMIHNQIVDSILQRRSIRSYTDEKLTKDEVNTLLQCGLWAPSAVNQQTTRMVATQNTKLIEELAEAADRPGFHYGAPCFIFFYGLKGNKWSKENASLAVENATLAAYSMGLGSVIIGCVSEYLQSADSAAVWKEKLGIPENYDFVLGLLVGHPKESPEPKARNQENILWK